MPVDRVTLNRWKQPFAVHYHIRNRNRLKQLARTSGIAFHWQRYSMQTGPQIAKVRVKSGDDRTRTSVLLNPGNCLIPTTPYDIIMKEMRARCCGSGDKPCTRMHPFLEH